MNDIKKIYFSRQTTSCCKEFPGSIILGSITGREKLPKQNRRVRIGPVRRPLVTWITSPRSNWVFDGGSLNSSHIIMMKIMDYCLIWSTAVEDMGKQASKTIHRFWQWKMRSSILRDCRFGWTETASLVDVSRQAGPNYISWLNTDR
jgi:hypothetical protein